MCTHARTCVLCVQTGVEDPFTQLAEGKKKRVAINKKSQLQNAKLADQQGQLPATLKLTSALGPGSGSNSKAAGPRALPKQKRKELQEEVRFCLTIVSLSLAMFAANVCVFCARVCVCVFVCTRVCVSVCAHK